MGRSVNVRSFAGIIGVTALTGLLLGGCGGGGGGAAVSGPTGGSGGAGAIVQGQIVRSQSAALREPVVVVWLRTALGIGLAEAQAGTPVAGATVTLMLADPAGPAPGIAPEVTDANGQFVFRNVPAGTYTVQVAVDSTVQTIALPAPGIVVGDGDTATIVGRVTQATNTAGEPIPGTVAVTARDTGDVAQNDAQLGHAVNIANASGSTCDLGRVLDLRESGLGWGVIAQQCGAPPAVIGRGRSNLTDSQLDDARQQAGRGRGRGRGRS